MSRSVVFWIAALGIVVAWVAGASPAHANAARAQEGSSDGPILVVVDLSGSMNDPDPKGKIKIQGAREAFAGLVAGLKGSTRLGVWTYPSDGSCGAGALTLGFTPAAGINAQAATDSWDVGGKTPTAQALGSAAEMLDIAGGNTIILISDGESNCSGDPCAVAAELEAEGFDVTVNTIGFDISDQGDSELRCISDATGGSHTNVENSDELAEALAALSDISLTVDVASKVLDDAIDTSFPTARVEVSARVANTGVSTARDLDVTLRFEGERRPFLVDGTRTLPVFAGGASDTRMWSFDVPIDCEDYVLEFSAYARVDGTEVASDTDSITITGRSDSVYCLLKDGGLAIVGDSYSSGEGAPPYDDGTNSYWNWCRRGQTYGREDRVGSAPVVLACSGAIIHDLLLPHGEHRVATTEEVKRLQSELPPPVDFEMPESTYPAGWLPLMPSQLEQLLGVVDDVDVVALTISGNDIGFSTIIQDCLFGSCEGGKTPSLLAARQGAASLTPTLTRALRILESSVNADRDVPIQFVLLPYVGLVPGAWDFPSNPADCPIGVNSLGIEIDAREAGVFDSLRRVLNSQLGEVARLLKAEGRPVHFAQGVGDALDGHDLCSPEPWGHSVQGIEWLRARRSGRPMESVHPNEEGYRAIWRSLLETTRDSPISNRSVVNEASIDGGQLCPDDGSLRIVALYDLGDLPPLEFVAGECIVVVGRMKRAEPPSTGLGSDDNAGLESWIVFEIRSEPELLGVAEPNEDGDFREVLWIPDDLPAGEHTFSAYVQDGSGTIEVLSRPVVLVNEPTAPYKIALGVALAMVLTGGGILTLAPGHRRRSKRSSDTA